MIDKKQRCHDRIVLSWHFYLKGLEMKKLYNSVEEFAKDILKHYRSDNQRVCFDWIMSTAENVANTRKCSNCFFYDVKFSSCVWLDSGVSLPNWVSICARKDKQSYINKEDADNETNCLAWRKI